MSNLSATTRKATSSAKHPEHPQASWWRVMCLTGVDYFSTLGYQPSIAFVAAGIVSPVATAILVVLTLFGALPVYRYVAKKSPNGQGSIAMLENLLPGWFSKLFVLFLIGFAATDFIITITLSAADAAAHVVQNPLNTIPLMHSQMFVTLLLLAALGAMFLKGFKEVIGVAILLVGVYLTLSAVIITVGIYQVAMQPTLATNWWQALLTKHGSLWDLFKAAAIVFPALALGFSGFETGVAVMPQVKGDETDTPENPAGRIRNTGKLLTAAACIMAVLLISSSFVTTFLIPADAFHHGGEADGRALAYLAHHYLGHVFGTIFDLSTVGMLWFAGASALAGLINLVPRFLPRYGMAPEWTRATRPLVLFFMAVAFAVTFYFRANVEAQGGAYATGVLVLITSAALAVTLSLRGIPRWLFALVTLVFTYTTLVNIYDRPDGIKVAAFFIIATVLLSFLSRIVRATELRHGRVEFDHDAKVFVEQAILHNRIKIIAHKPNDKDYAGKAKQMREYHNISASHALFLEVEVGNASEFHEDVLHVHGYEEGEYRILRCRSHSVANAIAFTLLYIRDAYGAKPHAYFDWSKLPPFGAALRYLLFGDGDTPPVTREVLRRAEPNEAHRPAIHVG